LNGEDRQFASSLTISKMLEETGYDPKYVAVAINYDCIRKDVFDTREINEGDEVEIVSPQAGG